MFLRKISDCISSRKKLRDIEALEAKLASGEISAPEPEQLEKVRPICICQNPICICQNSIINFFVFCDLSKILFCQVSRKADVMAEIAALEKMVA